MSPSLLSRLIAAVVILLTIAGCSSRDPSEHTGIDGEEPNQQYTQRDVAEKYNASMRNIYVLLRGIRTYRDNNGNWPDTLEQIREFTEDVNLADVMTNPLTGDHPGYEYDKPATDAELATTPIIFQMRDGERDLTLFSGGANGEILFSGELEVDE